MVPCRNLHLPFLNRSEWDFTNSKLVKSQAFKVTLNFGLAPLDIFNYYLREMIEKGVINQISERYEASQQVCPDLNGSPLGFESCFAAFLALIVGLIIGFVLVIFEIIAGKVYSVEIFGQISK